MCQRARYITSNGPPSDFLHIKYVCHTCIWARWCGSLSLCAPEQLFHVAISVYASITVHRLGQSFQMRYICCSLNSSCTKSLYHDSWTNGSRFFFSRFLFLFGFISARKRLCSMIHWNQVFFFCLCVRQASTTMKGKCIESQAFRLLKMVWFVLCSIALQRLQPLLSIESWF